MAWQINLSFWVTVLVIVLVLGFLWGLWVNRRHGKALYRRFLPALNAWGRPASARWLGGITTALAVRVQGMQAPYRSMDAIVLLEPREFWPIWWVTRLQGQRDALILRINLRRTPHTEWEWRKLGVRVPGFLPPAAEEGFTALNAAGFRGWVRPQREDAGPWPSFLSTYRDGLQALSLRKQRPHVLLRIRTQGLDLDRFLRDLAEVLQPWLA